jgi:hypothetical protein
MRRRKNRSDVRRRELDLELANPLDRLLSFAAARGGAGVCRRCGCTDDDCSGCVERTGAPCFWVEPDLCSACAAGGRP